MAYKSWSLAIAWLVIIGLFGLAGFGGVDGSRLLLLVALAVTVPALILTDSADVTPTSDGGDWPLRDIRSAIPAHAAA
jgi:hypothetical protein